MRSISRINALFWFFCALWLPVIVGCGPAKEDRSSQQKVLGGTKVSDGSWNNVVALVKNERIQDSYCSGVLVHPSLVLTAAHCVKDKTAAGILVFVGQTSAGNGFPADKLYSVKRIGYNPAYNNDGAYANDVGFVELNSRPVGYRDLVRLADSPSAAIKVRNIVHMVGFGTTSSGGYGIKNEADTSITSVQNSTFTFGKDGKFSCHGDSGGGVFIKRSDGAWRYIGVISRSVDKNGSCEVGAIAENAQAGLCWAQRDSGYDLSYALNGSTC